MRTLSLRLMFILLWLAATGSGRAQNPKRIVSLSPSITATLQQLDADSRIVGRTTYCPAALRQRPTVTVGNVLEVNIEKIIALRPDIVFSMAFTKEEVLQKLRAMGIRVKNFASPKDFDEICEQTLEIGSLAGFEREAQSMVKTEKAKVEAIRKEFLQSPPFKTAPRVFFQIGDHPIFPVIEGTFMNQYLTFLGLDNIVKDYKGGGISKEYVLRCNPDLMFISRMDGTGQQAAEDWKKFKQLRAVQTHRILMIDDTAACCPTPVFFRQTLEFIANHLKKM